MTTNTKPSPATIELNEAEILILLNILDSHIESILGDTRRSPEERTSNGKWLLNLYAKLIDVLDPTAKKGANHTDDHP